MTPRRTAPALALLLFALTARAADKDNYGDPLPDGAQARIGTARLRSLVGPQLTPDGKSLYAQSNNGLTRVDPVSGAKMGKPTQQYGSLAAFSANGKRAVHVSYDRLVVWNTDTGAEVMKMERRLPSVEPQSPAALSADGKTLAVGGIGDRTKKVPVTVLVWDTATDKQLTSITAPQNDYVSVALSGDGKTLASWGNHYDPNAKPADADTGPGRFVNFWDAASGKELAKFRISGYMASAVAFSPDGALAAVAGNSTIELVDPKTGASKRVLLGRSMMGRYLAFSPDGATLAATADDGAVQRWRVADGARLSTTEPPTPSVSYTRVRLTDNEKGVAWGTKGIAAVVWEVPSGKLISPEGGHTSVVRGIAVTADNNRVLTSSDDGTSRQWELATGKPAGEVAIRRPSSGYSTYAPPAVFAPGGTRALVPDTSGGLGVHDLSAGGGQQFVVPVPQYGSAVGSFSADGAKVVVTSSSYDYKKTPARVTVWDAATGQKLGGVELPGYSQLAAAVTPDGKHVVTAGVKPAEKGPGAFVVAGWEVATGAKKGEMSEPSGYTSTLVTAAADNKTAAVVTAQGKLIAFDLLTGAKGKEYDTKARAPALTPVFSPDGKRLAVVGPSSFGDPATTPIVVLDWATGEIKHTFTSPGYAPQSMCFSPDSKWLVTGAPDTTATVWDVSK